MLQSNEFYANRLRKYYENMGFQVEIENDDEFSPVGVFVSNSPDMSCDWQNDKITSFYFYFYPKYNRAKSEEDLKFMVHLSSMGVRVEDRGKKIASKFIEGIIRIFGYDLGYIELDDLSGTDIWRYFANKYDHVEWKFC